MQQDAPALSVLVPTHGRPDACLRLLDGLAAQTLTPERFEVIVVDDGTPEPIALDPGRYPFPLTLLRQEQAGPGAARNRGLERCTAPLVLFLNDDAVPAPDLCERHLAAHERAPERTAVLGTFRFSEAARASAFVRLLDESDLLFSFSKLRPGELHDWRFFWTCNLSLPVAAVRGAGGFDAERFPEAIVEDCELGYRLELEGWRVFHAPECRCEHDHVLTPDSFLRRAERLGFFLARMQAKHRLPEILWCKDEAEVEALRAGAIDRVELHRTALDKLRGALEQLVREYAEAPVPASTAEQALRLVSEVGYAAFAAGVHRAVTGVDPLRVDPPRGELTSVVVVSCDHLDHTRRCVEALRAGREDEHPIEILVVDNGSTDGSAEWLAEQDDLILVANDENLGAPRARNQATVHARGAWIAYLDGDVFVPAGWLSRALYHGAVDPRVGTVALVANRASKHQQVPYEGTDSREDIEAFATARHAELERRGLDCDLFTSLAVLVRREVIDHIGGFDERFSPWGFEDDDLALRVRFAGWRNRVALDTFVYHAPYPDADKHARHSAHLATNWERFVEKWGRPGPVPELFDYAALDLSLERPVDEGQLVFALPGKAPEPEHELRPAPAGTRRSVLVLGAGRSGTSMLAGTLAEAGWNPGPDPYPGRDSNPKGFYETAEINGINEALIAAAYPTARPAGRMQRWLTAADAPVPSDAPAHLTARMRRLAARRPFAFKDPRFCLTLAAWREAVGELGVVCVFRGPADTAESTLREVGEADYLADVELDFDGAVAVWTSAYRNALAQRDDDWLFLHFDQLLTDEGLARLEAFVGGPVRRDFPEAAWKRASSERPVPAEAAALYAELCELAGHRAEPIPTTAAPAPRPVDPPELTVLVCTYQRRDTLSRCLRSFEEQTAAGRYELVVVNDGSTDGTRELLDGWDFRVPARIVHRENGGLSAARNTGLEVARGRYVLLVNDDTIADAELVERHLEAHARETGEVAVLGTFEQPEEVLDGALMRVLENDTLVFCFSQLRPGERHDWNAFWTCNVSVSTEAVRAVGCFDESFRHYGCEDTDLAIRLHQRGIEVVYEPEARANHDHVLDLDDLERRNTTTAAAWVRLFRKHPAALDHPYWRARRGQTVEQLERTLVEALPERPALEASVRTLSRIDLGALERTGPAGAELARACEAALRSQLRVLNRLWWAEGHVAGLRGFGVASFEELVAGESVAEAEGPEGPDGIEPWPLATEAEHRLIAWPRYGDEGDLERLLGTWAECLATVEDACLCLRHDARFDGPLDAALVRLETAWEATVPAGVDLEVLLVDGEMSADDLARLGLAVEAVLDVPGCGDPAREAFANAVARPRLTSPATV